MATRTDRPSYRHGKSFVLAFVTGSSSWSTDSSATPNAYYDEQKGAPNWISPVNLSIFDDPSFNGPLYSSTAQESWFARFNDCIFCNCQLVSTVTSDKHRLWKDDRFGPEGSGPVSIMSPQSGSLDYINKQIVGDGFAPVP